MDPGTEQLGGETGKTGTTNLAKEPFTDIQRLSPKERHIVAKMVETAYERGLEHAHTQPADQGARPIEGRGKPFAEKEWGWLYQGLNAGNTPFANTGQNAGQNAGQNTGQRGTESYGSSVGGQSSQR